MKKVMHVVYCNWGPGHIEVDQGFEDKNMAQKYLISILGSGRIPQITEEDKETYDKRKAKEKIECPNFD